ncbi:cyclin E-interacting protein minus isoform X2 [Anticarsia gemmatalis]|uniref:cyclin E-interacting protein minus isoform X2 n=1 Tax=Anticarsia gemmatalis TaxID=129554 RepID=UPI003F7584DF
MESFEDSNCHSMSDSFSLYERYLRSFNVVDPLLQESVNGAQNEPPNIINCDSESSHSGGNIELSIVTSNVINKHTEAEHSLLNQVVREHISDKGSSLDTDCVKLHSPCTPLAASLLENSSATVERSLINEKSNPIDVLISSEESKTETFKHPVFITPTMENSNNAVDSVPMFRAVRPTESVFKLPISELSFNGTLKHVQRMKPIVDPITALSSSTGLVSLEDKQGEECSRPFASCSSSSSSSSSSSHMTEGSSSEARASDTSDNSDRVEKASESTGDSQYEECKKDNQVANDDGNTAKWNSEQSYSSLEASFDSGVRSPDMFSEEDEDTTPEPEPFWSFLKDYEAYDKRKMRKTEETLQGVLPPPSVTIIKTDVTEMLKKYYCHLPLFNEDAKVDPPEVNTTPTKRVSFVEIPEKSNESKDNEDVGEARSSILNENSELDTSANDRSIHLKMNSEIEAAETLWPDVIKCRFYDVYYNVTKYSEKLELLALRYGERYVGAETDTSVNIYSGGMQSPSSASKRKAMRLKMAQAKSPGRRLSHLARRRQAFASAATIGEKAQTSTTKMVLIDKKKLINSSERKSPRTRRTPGKKTPTRKTPGKKTPAKTPKTRSGGSSKKKAMRRLLMDSDQMTRSQPTRETLKRALFISPDHRRPIPTAPSSSVPAQAMKSKRALFGSPVRTAETKSMDGTQSDQFLKRKRDMFDDEPDNNRHKIAKSLSFGGDTIGGSQSLSFARRNSEAFGTKSSTELNEHHKKKLLWAVSEALRVHGWRMSSPGFREKAAALARLTRRLLALPPHAAKLAAPKLSTSETMLKIARQYVFAIIQGRTVDECYQEEQLKIANEANTKLTGYISANAYQQLRARQNVPSTFTSQIKENTCSSGIKQEQPKSNSKNILQDKLVNIDSNSNSSSGMSMLDRSSLGLFKSNSMPSFEEAAKMRARRQISFDNVDFPKR